METVRVISKYKKYYPKYFLSIIMTIKNLLYLVFKTVIFKKVKSS